MRPFVSHNAVADLRGGAGDAPPPGGSKFFRFHAVFGKFWQNRMLAPPPRGNPGSATAMFWLLSIEFEVLRDLIGTVKSIT